MTESPGNIALRARAAARYRRLAAAREKTLLGAIVARYKEIDGGTLGGLISITLFTTVIPLIIIGFSYFSGFAQNASPGTIIIRELGLQHPLSDSVRASFGTSADLHSSWTLVGVAGFLVWGIPMTISIAGMFAKAWRREQLGRWQRLLRGTVWFALYLGMLVLREEAVLRATDSHGIVVIVLLLAGLAAVWLFWSLTPWLLVRDGGRGLKFLALAGLAGTVINGILIPVVARLFFPSLLAGMTALGPIGVAMAILMWCGIVGAAWVVTACAGAVIWERSAPAEMVIDTQEDDADLMVEPADTTG